MRHLLLLLLLTLALLAKDKVALVIANKNYTNQTGLNNPIRDAKLIRNTLQEMNFEVLEAYNKELDDLGNKLETFIAKARNAKVAVVYYAGHGIGVGSRNYLIPLHATNLTKSNLSRKLLSVEELKEAVASAKGFGVVLFDACRNSFFSGSIVGLSSGRASRALVPPSVTRANVLVSYSTQAGTKAEDDVQGGNHSPYAIALSENLKSNRDIRLVMGSIRTRVYGLTSNQQSPVEKDLLGGKEYCLSGVCEQKVVIDKRETERLRAEIALLKQQQSRAVQPKVIQETRRVETPTKSSNIVSIDGLMYQNQLFTKEDDNNLAERAKGRVQTWQGAIKYCQDLTLGDYSDWRLPTKNELKKLLTKKQHTTGSGDKLYIRPEFAKNFQKYGWAWSSTEKDSSNAWGVYFYGGNDLWHSKTLNLYALCVR